MQIGVKKIQFESGANFADPQGHMGLKYKRSTYCSISKTLKRLERQSSDDEAQNI